MKTIAYITFWVEKNQLNICKAPISINEIHKDDAIKNLKECANILFFNSLAEAENELKRIRKHLED